MLGHTVADKSIVPDNIYQIRAQVSKWIADPKIQVIISTGGTGVTGHDVTPEAIKPLLDKEIPGFAEIFRQISYEEIGLLSMQSRALAGTANGTYIFCLPGSTGAVTTGWDKILKTQLDTSQKCSFGKLLVRLNE